MPLNFENPYQPPSADPSAPTAISESMNCPGCGTMMKPGFATGRLLWQNDDASSLRKFFLTSKKVLLGASFRITLTTPKAPGHHCEACGLTIMKIPL